jgi:hypothetical protein
MRIGPAQWSPQVPSSNKKYACRSYPLVAPICSCAVSEERRSATELPALPARRGRAATSKPRLPSASLLRRVANASLLRRVANASLLRQVADAACPLTSAIGPLPPANSTRRWASILPSSKEMLQCVENVCFMCFRCFIDMLQLFHADATKVDQDITYVVMVVHVCCKICFQCFTVLSDYVVTVFLSRCCICFTHMFHAYVASVLSGYCVCFAMVFKCFPGVFLQVF